jgi:translation initiation factor eIF-2B subunit delta
LLENLKKESDRTIIHPALLEFALQSAQDLVLDEDERTRVFLRMVAQQIRDEPAEEREFKRTINGLIARTMTFLYSSKKRVTPIGIGQAVRVLKKANGADDPPGSSADLRRQALLLGIERFIEEKIDDVAEVLERKVAEAIVDDDVVLTYAWSPVICRALKSAHASGVRFRLIVVDSRPNFDARRLVEQVPELDVRYVLITGVSYVMTEVKKVLIEPCGILSNNAAQTPIGTAMISMMAHEAGVPVIFVCPSYRFVSRVSIDALSKNERLAKELVRPVPRSDIVADPLYLSLTYDVTPGQYVDLVMSELGNIPVNSISTNIKYIQDSYTPVPGTVEGQISLKPGQ